MVSLAIPLSMLVAFVGMVQASISGNLMSLGPSISGSSWTAQW